MQIPQDKAISVPSRTIKGFGGILKMERTQMSFGL